MPIDADASPFSLLSSIDYLISLISLPPPQSLRSFSLFFFSPLLPLSARRFFFRDAFFFDYLPFFFSSLRCLFHYAVTSFRYFRFRASFSLIRCCCRFDYLLFRHYDYAIFALIFAPLDADA